jgi:dynein intermediate chain
LTFERAEDYVYDVQWCPVHPSVFACCDGEGYLEIWDLNKDVELPQVRKSISKKAINKIRWSNDGRKIAAGDSTGKLSVWNVDKDVSYFFKFSDDQPKTR